MPEGVYLTKEAVKRTIRPIVKPYWARKIATYAGFGDLRYYAPTLDEVQRIITPIQPPAPLGELFDCDDYAYFLKAQVARYTRQSEEFDAPVCIGIAWGRFRWISGGRVDHACNWVLDAGGQFRWLEPQDNTLHTPDKSSGFLTLLLV